jgi:hypothetical protein
MLSSDETGIESPKINDEADVSILLWDAEGWACPFSLLGFFWS